MPESAEGAWEATVGPAIVYGPKASGGNSPCTHRNVIAGNAFQVAVKPLGSSTMSPGFTTRTRCKSQASVAVMVALPARTLKATKSSNRQGNDGAWEVHNIQLAMSQWERAAASVTCTHTALAPGALRLRPWSEDMGAVQRSRERRGL